MTDRQETEQERRARLTYERKVYIARRTVEFQPKSQAAKDHLAALLSRKWVGPEATRLI